MNTPNKSHDILARLLATENLTVIRKNVSTASFDIQNRVLVLPKWKKLTEAIEEMLILHEVGHALYTTPEGYGEVYVSKRHLRGYANILEDVRIEKKMKERYPGSRKSFNAGYTQLNDQDFFEVKDKDFSELLLIDRINLYYKVGYSAGIPFTAEEYQYVQRADKTVTEEDVLSLAEEIYNYCKGKLLEEDEEEQIQKKLKRGKFDGDSDDPYEDYDGEFDEDEDEEEPEELQPETNSSLEKNLEKHQDKESRTYYYDAVFERNVKSDRIVSYKDIMAQLSERYAEIGKDRIKQNANTFKIESTNIINYLVKEFEMRKSASAYKRTKISKLGQLDTRKLFAYKLKDDIFKQIATVQQGKNHGMIFLLDWSGSMNTYMYETVEQVINLAMFCQKINIPYQVLAFSDGYDDNKHFETTTINETGIDDMACFHLLELFSNKMNTRDFNTMIEYLLDSPWNRRNNFSLNGTPLNHSLLYMVDYIGKYMKQNDIEKMNLITLTDGESNTLHRHNYSGSKTLTSIKDGMTYVYEDGMQARVNASTFLRDPITRKEYRLTDEASQQTEVLCQLLKDRYNIKVVGFHITATSYNAVNRFVKHNLGSDMSASQRHEITTRLQAEVRKNKGAVAKNVPGRDEMYIISSNAKIQDDDLNTVRQDMSAAQISKQLGKMFTSRKSSRVVLNSFIEVVA